MHKCRMFQASSHHAMCDEEPIFPLKMSAVIVIINLYFGECVQ